MKLRDPINWLHPRSAVVMHDLGMTLLAWWLANTLRYAMLPYGQELDIISRQTLIVLGVGWPDPPAGTGDRAAR